MELKARIKNLNHEIKSYFYSEKRSNVRKNLKPGNSKSLWKAVNMAKDIGSSSIPCKLTLGHITIREHGRSEYFASFSEDKVESIIEQVQVEQDVFNG